MTGFKQGLLLGTITTKHLRGHQKTFPGRILKFSEGKYYENVVSEGLVRTAN